MKSFLRRYRMHLAAVFFVGAVGFGVILLASDSGAVQNIGYLMLGMVVAILGGALADILRQPIHADDLARVLHLELSELVARCCYDYEGPWSDWTDDGKVQHAGVTIARALKFMPAEPHVYCAAGAQLALLPPAAAQALMQFQYRLDAWRRDLKNFSDTEYNNAGRLNAGAVQLLAIRLSQTIEPGHRALQTLGACVEGAAAIEDAAIAALDRTIDHKQSGGLRARLARLVDAG